MSPLDRFFRVGLPLTVVALLGTVLAVGMTTHPDRLEVGFAPDQPIPFSHKLHAGDNEIPCLYCHSGASRSRHATVPSVDLCFQCHEVTKTESPHIQRLASIRESQEVLAWKRVYSLPDHVYFDHRPHVNSGIECQSCHGPVEEMEELSQHMSLRMGDCLNCHRGAHEIFEESVHEASSEDAGRKLGPEFCNACHR